jgi:hypothetical protein
MRPTSLVVTLSRPLSLAVLGLLIAVTVVGCALDPFHQQGRVQSIKGPSICVSSANGRDDYFNAKGFNVFETLRVGDCIKMDRELESLRVLNLKKVGGPEDRCPDKYE